MFIIFSWNGYSENVFIYSLLRHDKIKNLHNMVYDFVSGWIYDFNFPSVPVYAEHWENGIYIAFSILFGVLVFSRPDEWITRYNAQQYLSGNLPEFDTRVISEMSEDAWAAMASYSRNDLIKLYSSHHEKNINPEEIFEDVHEELEKDIYQKLNLSAWEIMYHGQ